MTVCDIAPRTIRISIRGDTARTEDTGRQVETSRYLGVKRKQVP